MDTQVRAVAEDGGTSGWNRWLVIWGVVRLPLLAIVLYLLRQEILELVERVMGVGALTVRAIALISTFSERVLLFGGCVVVLSTSIVLAQRLRSKWAQLVVPVAIAFMVFLALLILLPTRRAGLIATLLTTLLAVNIVPDSWVIQSVTTGIGQRMADGVFGLGIALSEFLLPKPFLLWLLTRSQGPAVVVTGLRRQIVDLLPVLIVSALAAFVTSNAALVNLGWTLYPDAAVQRFAEGDINMLAFNRSQKLLYASGRGLGHIQAYNVAAIDQPPRASKVSSNYAQGFYYNPLANELYVYHSGLDALLLIDAFTLEQIRSIPVPDLSPGDPWIVWDRFSDNIIIASEADRQEGTPFVVVNRTTGKVVTTKDLSPSYIYLNPEKPLLYMNFFRRTTDLMAYDTQTNEIVKQVPSDKQVDRMAIVPNSNELLVSSPVNSSLLRYDANTLERKGAIKTTFGVRTVAVDTSRNLLLSGSLATNMLEVLDLKTHKRLAHYRLGPWLREICLDTDAGMAYVSSNGALFKVDYTARL